MNRFTLLSGVGAKECTYNSLTISALEAMSTLCVWRMPLLANEQKSNGCLHKHLHCHGFDIISAIPLAIWIGTERCS